MTLPVSMQYFWFRHTFLLGDQGAGSIQEVVLLLLRDRKLEVQDMAAGLLAGLLRGLSPTHLDQLRVQCLDKANELFPVGKGNRRRKKPADNTAGGLWLLCVFKHACLKTAGVFLLSQKRMTCGLEILTVFDALKRCL